MATSATPEVRKTVATLGGWIDAKGRYPGDGSHPVGSRGEDPIGGLVDESPS